MNLFLTVDNFSFEPNSVDDELETSANAVFDLLRRNFLSHYNTDRSPFGLYTRQAWFLNDDITNSTARHDGFQMSGLMIRVC